MIQYKCVKINKIYKNIEEILKKAKIDIENAKATIDKVVISKIETFLESVQAPAEKFVKTPCPKCGKCHLEVMNAIYVRDIIFRIRKSFGLL